MRIEAAVISFYRRALRIPSRIHLFYSNFHIVECSVALDVEDYVKMHILRIAGEDND